MKRIGFVHVADCGKIYPVVVCSVFILLFKIHLSHKSSCKLW